MEPLPPPLLHLLRLTTISLRGAGVEVVEGHLEGGEHAMTVAAKMRMVMNAQQQQLAAVVVVVVEGGLAPDQLSLKMRMWADHKTQQRGV